MNDPMIERATGRLAERVIKDANGDLPKAVTLAFRELIGRAPSPKEADRALSYVGTDAAKMKSLAWMLYNLDEFLFVR
mgnify:CR=1 FL=1